MVLRIQHSPRMGSLCPPGAVMGPSGDDRKCAEYYEGSGTSWNARHLEDLQVHTWR